MQATAMKLNQEAFVDRQDVRELYIGRVDVLDKVKELVFLKGTEEMTLKLLCEFYGVEEGAITMLKKRNFDELTADGMRVVRGDGLSNIKLVSGHKSPAGSLTLFPRRSILRVGMLLRDSEVAKQIRTYLLNVEETASLEHKNNALIYDGHWTQEQMKYLLETVVSVVRAEGTATEAFAKVAEAMNIKPVNVSAKWQNTVKKYAPTDVLEKIRNNRRGSTLVLLNGGKSENKEGQNDSNMNLLSLAEQLEELKREIVQMRHKDSNKEIQWAVEHAELVAKLNTQEEIVAMKDSLIAEKDKHINTLNLLVAEKTEEVKRWKRKAQSLQESFNIFAGHEDMEIGKSTGNKFKMDGNGNLERIKN